MIWHLITPEYPPQSGGVSHYVDLLAEALDNSQDEVHVWCPPGEGPAPESRRAHVHQELGAVSIADLFRLGKALDRFPRPRHILVQWVPHGYRYRSMNLPFCVWLWARSVIHGDSVEIMLHEAFLAFRQGNWRQDAAALVHRLMMTILLHSTRRVWMSTPGIGPVCKPYAFGRTITFGWLPIPSTVPVTAAPGDVAGVRRRYQLNGQPLVGHFGTFGDQTVPFLEMILPGFLAKCGSASLLLIGRDSDAFQRNLLETYPEFAGRVHSTGHIDDFYELSCHLSACDLMLQPYPDGINTRRTSMMASLAHGRPIVTTSGLNTEDFWAQSGAVAIAPVHQTDAFIEAAQALLMDEPARTRMGAAASMLYQRRFDMHNVVNTLHNARDKDRLSAAASKTA